MAIPDDQLTRWCNQGGTTNSIAAHTSIRNALESNDSLLSGRNFEIFLQGSYRNSTNIRADSDVDLVVQLNEVFYKDLSRLNGFEKIAQERTYDAFGPARHNAVDWRADVGSALRKKFGNALKPGGGKAFHVVTGPGNMTADVLPAVRFKDYTSFRSVNEETFDEGAEFVDAAGNYIVNFPKLHIEHGEAKNSLYQTNGRYKPSVRMFKNARNCMIERNRLGDGVAPSYFVECLLYNVPEGNYSASPRDTFFNVTKYLYDNQNLIVNFRCQNGRLALFGMASTQWNTTDASEFIGGLANLWDHWE